MSYSASLINNCIVVISTLGILDISRLSVVAETIVGKYDIEIRYQFNTAIVIYDHNDPQNTRLPTLHD